MKWLEIRCNLRTTNGEMGVQTFNLDTQGWEVVSEFLAILEELESWAEREALKRPNLTHTVGCNLTLDLCLPRHSKDCLAEALSHHSTMEMPNADGQFSNSACVPFLPKTGNHGREAK